jgi:hypothetical protein
MPILDMSCSAPPTPVGHPTVAIVGSPTKASDLLAHRWRAYGIDAMVLDPDSALERLGPGDVALVRLDVLPTLDGIEPGLDQVRELAHRGVHVLNRPEALLAMHDKLRTARTLAAAGIPHPTTVHVPAAGPVPAVPVPGVLKPRLRRSKVRPRVSEMPSFSKPISTPAPRRSTARSQEYAMPAECGRKLTNLPRNTC